MRVGYVRTQSRSSNLDWNGKPILHDYGAAVSRMHGNARDLGAAIPREEKRNDLAKQMNHSPLQECNSLRNVNGSPDKTGSRNTRALHWHICEKSALHPMRTAPISVGESGFESCAKIFCRKFVALFFKGSQDLQPLIINHYTLANSLGLGSSATMNALRTQKSGLIPCAFEDVDLETYIAKVDELDNYRVRADLSAYECRNNRLAQLCLQQDGFGEAIEAARKKYGAARIGVFMGTSTSGILQTELAYRLWIHRPDAYK